MLVEEKNLITAALALWGAVRKKIVTETFGIKNC